MLKQIALKYLPESLLEWTKKFKKQRRKLELKRQESSKLGINKEKLVYDLIKIGIRKGDSILVHSSLSKIGFVEGGPKTIIDALAEVVGDSGTLLFPAFSAPGRSKDYLETDPVFDITNTISHMGIISEYFRKKNGVLRSFHPTDSVCAEGPLAEYYTNTHYGQLTPYNEYSPFRKLCKKKGKILMLGTTLNGACTNLHTLEDAVDFKFPVYSEKIYNTKMIDKEGRESTMKTKVHNPEYSAKRNCDALKPMFAKEGVLVDGLIGEAKSMLIDADKMLHVMIKYYNEKGVTMYTPFGSK